MKKVKEIKGKSKNRYNRIKQYLIDRSKSRSKTRSKSKSRDKLTTSTSFNSIANKLKNTIKQLDRNPYV